VPFLVVKVLIKHRVTSKQIMQRAPQKKFSAISEVFGEAFRAHTPQIMNASGSPYDLRRYYVADDYLFYSDGRTYVLSEQ